MMKKLILALTGLALLTGFSAPAADKENAREKRETKADIDKHIQTINKLDNKEAARRAGMEATSKETGVPVATIEAEHKQHPKVGVAGLFLAHELSVHTKKPVDHFIRQRVDGKSWNELATANGQDLNAIDAKLTRIEEVMRKAK